MLKLVADDVPQGSARLQAGCEKDASSNGGMRHYLQVMRFGIATNTHELRDACVPHLRLHDVNGLGVDA